MAKRKRDGSDAVDRAAEAFGHALGSVVGTIESLQAQHPHPVDEAREALAAGQERLAAVTSRTSTRATAMIKKAKAVARHRRREDARPTKEHGGRGPRDAHGANDGEARQEGRQARPEDRGTRSGPPEAVGLSRDDHAADSGDDGGVRGRFCTESSAEPATKLNRVDSSIWTWCRFSAATCPAARSPRGTPFPTPLRSAVASTRPASSRVA